MEDQNPNPSPSDAAQPPEVPSARPPLVSEPPATPPPYTAQQVYGYGTTPSYTPAYAAPVPQTNAWAIVSLVSSILGWLGLFGLGGIVGVVTGLIARNQIKENPVTQTGDGLALAGIILGAVNIILVCVGALCFLVVFAGLFSVPFWGGGR